jgi:predicted nucleotide-binding protein
MPAPAEWEQFQALGSAPGVISSNRPGRRLREERGVVLSPKKVFVVHGHDEGPKETVARFLSELGLEAVVPNEQSNSGRTMIEKLLAHADIAFAVVLLTPDDRGESKAIGREALR